MSPSTKTMYLDTENNSNGSPCRIKVTVQAEPAAPPINRSIITSRLPLIDIDTPSLKRSSPERRSSRKPTPSRRRHNSVQARDLIVIPDDLTSDYSLSELEPQDVQRQDKTSQNSPQRHQQLTPSATSQASQIASISQKSVDGSRDADPMHDAPSADVLSPSDPGFPAEQEWSENDDAVTGAENPGDATVLESEEFSMISVDSLASAPHRDHELSVDTSTRPSGDISVMPSSPPIYLAGSARTPFLSNLSSEDPAAPAQTHEHAPVETPLQESARKSGRALQDVLKGPFRSSTPGEQASGKAVFNGFSAGTRRQLRESLYAGQIMATPPLASQPNFGIGIQGGPHFAAPISTFDSPFHSPVRRTGHAAHRLPTPEGKDDSKSSLSCSNQHEVQYPSLEQSSGALGYDDMSWVATGATRAISTQGSPPQPSEVTTREHRDLPPARLQRETSQIGDASARALSHPDHTEQDDGALKDIWQAEATDLPLKPRRSKLPGTWRRTSTANFHYSDSPEPEAAPSRRVSTATSASGILTPPTTEDEQFPQKFEPSTTSQHQRGEELEENADGDETGVFWQTNLPAVFNRPQPVRSARSKLQLSPPRHSIDSSLQVDATIAIESPTKDTLAEEHDSLSQRTTLPKATLLTTKAARSDCIFMPSPLKRSLYRSSKYTATRDNSVQDSTTFSLASDELQLHSELMQHTLADSPIDMDQTAASSENSELETETNMSQSYVEELNRDSPTKIKVKFNDSSVQESAHESTIHDDLGRSVLISPKKRYPPLFESATSAPSNLIAANDGDDIQKSTQTKIRQGGYVSRLTESFWGAVTAQPVYTEARPTIVRSMSPMTAAEAVTNTTHLAMSTTSSVPDHVLRLRRKYGLLPDEYPFTYAHVRTLHRMLNSARARGGSSSIIPTSGPLPDELQDLVGRTRTNDLDQQFTWTPKYAHVVTSFMSLLLPARERKRLVEHTGKEWGDAEALRYRGVDSKGRKGTDRVYDEEKVGKIGSLWVAHIVEDILWKEEMNAKKKRVQEMLSRVEKPEEKLSKVRPA